MEKPKCYTCKYFDYDLFYYPDTLEEDEVFTCLKTLEPIYSWGQSACDSYRSEDDY